MAPKLETREEVQRGPDLIVRKTARPTEYDGILDLEIAVVRDKVWILLNNLLPPGWKILEMDESLVPNLQLSASAKTMAILSPKTIWTEDGAMVIFLHEAGHARNYSQMGRDAIERNVLLRNHKKAYGIQKLPEDLLREYAQNVVHDEKTASEWALGTFKKIMDAGINLEPHLTIAEIEKMNDEALLSYLSEDGEQIISTSGVRLIPHPKSLPEQLWLYVRGKFRL
ncbi:hypothetical protein M0P48_00700 [Candidatus Gracilibacteria bacterium]|jgi:hypothetical protein|nr:hypothetical protein [Candidatus Gracilibacteria bacterium]